MQAHVASDEGKAAYTSYQSKQSAYYTGSYSYATMMSQTGSTLFCTINALMGSTCLNGGSGYSYNNLRSQYINVDRDLNNSSNIIGYYDGSSFSGTWDSGTTWNREHTWPQSKFKGTNNSGTSIPIGYDMQSVRPASTSVNSSRSNTAYGEGSSYYDPNEISINNSNYKSSNNGTYRGDCARVILYDYVVYGKWGSCSNSLYKSSCTVDLLTQIGTNSNSVFESLAILLKWHMQDPPSLTEMVRNDGGQDYQGNRNVFIDYPELAINMLKDQTGVTAYTVTYNITETASPAYAYTTPAGFVTYLTNSLGGHPTSVTVTGATYTYDSTLGRLTITNVTGAVTISTTSTPTLSVSSSSITIGPIATSSFTTQTFTVTGANLTGSISITKNSGSSSYITVSPTSITSGYNGTNIITITYNAPASAGTHTATLTISSPGATSVTVNITASCAASYTATWMANGSQFDTSTTASGGRPDVPATNPSNCSSSRVFVGWTESSSVSSEPADLFTTTAPEITTDKTFYAVYADASTSGGGSPTIEYVKVTSEPADWSGNYLVVYEAGGLAFNGLSAKGESDAVTISNNTIAHTTALEKDEVIIASMSGGYSLQMNSSANNNASKYLYGTSGSNAMNFGDAASANTISISSGDVTITSNTSVLRYNTTASSGLMFRYYKSTSTTFPLIQLFKRIETGGSITTYSNYSTYCSSSYTITVNAGAGGTASGGGTYANGSSQIISATPSTCYQFLQWNDGNTDNPRTITVSGDATYTATFEQITYRVTATSDDSSKGTVNVTKP